MRDNPTTTELIRRALASRLADVHVSMPASVVSYDAATKTATIQPGIKRVLFDDNEDRVVEEIPPIPNVPVEFPGAGSLSLHFALTAGDTGRLSFFTNSIAEWRQTGKPSEPGSLKIHDLGACVFTPGLRHSGNVNSDADNSIGKPGGLRVGFETSRVTVGDGSDLAVLAGDATSGLAKLLTDILQAGASAGGPGAANFTAAAGVLSALLATPAWPAAVGGKLAVEP